jgi:hypothetical protein
MMYGCWEAYLMVWEVSLLVFSQVFVEGSGDEEKHDDEVHSPANHSHRFRPATQ